MKSELDKKWISEKAEHWYETKIKYELNDAQSGFDLAIDANTGEYEIGNGAIELSERLRKRIPDADVFLMKHGSAVTLRSGFRSTYGSLVGPRGD